MTTVTPEVVSTPVSPSTVAPTSATTATATASPAQSVEPRRERADDDRPALRPPVDVLEDAGGITLIADVPGVSKDGLHLRLDGDRLTIDAEMSLALPEAMTASHADVTVQRYRRAFTLSRELDPAQIAAELSHGVLKVRIPKAAHAQPRRIDVRVG